MTETRTAFAVLAGKTRTGVASKALGDAKERCEEIETQVVSAFTQLERAIDLAAECGVVAEVTLGFPLGVAWDAYRRDRRNREAVREEQAAKRAARAELGVAPAPLP